MAILIELRLGGRVSVGSGSSPDELCLDVDDAFGPKFVSLVLNSKERQELIDALEKSKTECV